VDLALALIGFTIAIWGQMVSSATDRIEEFENIEFRVLSAVIVLVGGVSIIFFILLASSVAFAVGSSIGNVLALIIIGSIVLAFPHIAALAKIVLVDRKRLSRIKNIQMYFMIVMIFSIIFIIVKILD